jgi:hypothetical protein
MRKLKIIHFILLFLILAITSCSINKDSISNNKIADAKTNKHLSHSGKFGRCSLCASQLQASQSTDSAVSPLADQPAEQEQIFASNAAQENIILKSSKFNFEESFENFENSTSIGEKEIFSTKKTSSYKFQQQSKPESKKSTDKDLQKSRIIFALLILSLFFINTELATFIIFPILMYSLLLYGLYKLLELFSRAIKETPKEKKIYWLLVPILILPALFVLIALLPILVFLSPLAIIYVTYRLIRTRKKEKSAAQKLGILTLVAVLLGLLALLIFVPWFSNLLF